MGTAQGEPAATRPAQGQGHSIGWGPCTGGQTATPTSPTAALLSVRRSRPNATGAATESPSRHGVWTFIKTSTSPATRIARLVFALLLTFYARFGRSPQTREACRRCRGIRRQA